MHSERRLVMLGYGKLSVTLAALAGFLLFTGAPRVRAGESECEHRTERADHRLVRNFTAQFKEGVKA
jgi:hypothetical protein